MMLVETTTVPDGAFPIAAFREHLRLGTGFADDGLQDGLLTGFLRAAMAAVEGRTGKILLERDFAWTRDGWQGETAQDLPVAPVSAVAGVDLIAPKGAETVADAASWRLVPDLHVPRLEATRAVLPRPSFGGSVRVRFTAGFGPDWGDLPADLGQAVMLLAAHYNEYRHDTGLDAGCMPFGVTALIERYRTFRLFGRGRA
ncbi:head-tail connector protein [Wenxinia marina]|nr:hypothetical protein [Wenxinia marina]